RAEAGMGQILVESLHVCIVGGTHPLKDPRASALDYDGPYGAKPTFPWLTYRPQQEAMELVSVRCPGALPAPPAGPPPAWRSFPCTPGLPSATPSSPRRAAWSGRRGIACAPGPTPCSFPVLAGVFGSLRGRPSHR